MLSVCLVAVASPAAYLWPVSEESVREAYFLGSGDREQAARFLGQYVREYPEPAKGAWVYRIDFRTPYEEIVRRSWEKTVGYSAQQAKEDYYARPDLVVVHVRISLALTWDSASPSTTSSGRPIRQTEGSWTEFPVNVAQVRPIAPKAVRATPLYSRGRGSISGVDILLEFDATKFAAAMTKVEVTTPDGNIIRAEFDLGKLK